eukprot:TRINITY_DN12573_c0_g1_i3.p1 TRINITY_DN12573_c0_g1~~TRINITY_DN12573_c0_g1_i3.p1  ORF type:complete len:158 (+),score=2.67 TRINITY_DN12573_c0_g1_i3:252-725(+)
MALTQYTTHFLSSTLILLLSQQKNEDIIRTLFQIDFKCNSFESYETQQCKYNENSERKDLHNCLQQMQICQRCLLTTKVDLLVTITFVQNDKPNQPRNGVKMSEKKKCRIPQMSNFGNVEYRGGQGQEVAFRPENPKIRHFQNLTFRGFDIFFFLTF